MENSKTMEWTTILFKFKEHIIKYLFFGWLIPFMLKTKIGIVILTFIRNIWYLILNPKIIFSLSIVLNFSEEIDEEYVLEFLNNSLNKALKNFGCTIINNRLNFKELTFDIDTDNQNEDSKYRIIIRGNQNNLTYRDFRNFTKKRYLLNFLKIISKSALSCFSSNEVNILYQINFMFLESKNNFFINERLSSLKNLSDANINVNLIVEDYNTQAYINATKEKLCISCFNDIEEFNTVIILYSPII